jgi:hypothetical protein
VPWLVVIGVPFLLHRWITEGLSEGWLWFYAGVIVSIVGIYGSIAYVVYMQRRSENEEKT